jgi:hypothetical protein
MELKVTTSYRAVPTEGVPLHSDILVTNNMVPGRVLRYEQVPNVLVDELIHELKESAKTALESAFGSIQKELGKFEDR